MNDDDLSTEPLIRVVCAAIRHKDGTVIAGTRHYDSIMRATILRMFKGQPNEVVAAREAGWYDCEQGFLNNKQEYLTREQAWKVAEAAKQIRQVTGTPGALYSEDLY